MANKIQLRRDTASNWTRINPVLADGEPGLDITNNKLKMGDGTTAWASLSYLTSEASASLVAGEYAATLGTDGKLSVPGFNIDGVNGLSAIYSNFDNPASAKQIYISPSDTDTGMRLPPDDLAGGEPIHIFNANSNGQIKLTAGNEEWTFDAEGSTTLPPGGIVTSTLGSDGTVLNITNVEVNTVEFGFRVTVTVDANHNLGIGDLVFIDGITTTTELNGQSYYVVPGGTNDFVLYQNADLYDLVDGSGFTNYVETGNRPLTQAPDNGVTLVTDDSPWGAGYNSIRLNGGGWLQADASSDFNIGTNDFAVSFWVKQIEYAGAPRLFSFGSWSTETLAISSEGSTNLYVWLNGEIINQGSNNGISLDPTWNHIALSRWFGHLYLYVNGTSVFDTAADTINLSAAATKKLTIGAQESLISGLNGFIRDFKIDVGQGINTATFTVPTGPATVNDFTKVLVLGNSDFLDSAGHWQSGGGGTALEKIPGGNVEIQTNSAPNGSKAGDIVLTAEFTSLKVDGKRNRVVIADPGGDYPINSTGQYTLQIDEGNVDTPFEVTDSKINLVYIWSFGGFSSSNTQLVQLPTPGWPGAEMTVINETPMTVDVVGWDGPSYTMAPYDTIKLISYRSPNDSQLYWWVTSAWVW